MSIKLYILPQYRGLTLSQASRTKFGVSNSHMFVLLRTVKKLFVDADCTGPEGWTQRGSNWYKTMSNLTYSFDEANTYCRSYGAQLPIFKTKAELNNLVASISMIQWGSRRRN